MDSMLSPSGSFGARSLKREYQVPLSPGDEGRMAYYLCTQCVTFMDVWVFHYPCFIFDLELKINKWYTRKRI